MGVAIIDEETVNQFLPLVPLMANKLKIENKSIELLTIEEVSMILKIEVPSAKKFLKGGKVKQVVLSDRSIRYKLTDIEKFINDKTLK